MDDISHLYEKRKQLWKRSKAFLDSKLIQGKKLSSSDAEKFDAMEAEIVEFDRQISYLEQKNSRQSNMKDTYE